MMKEKDIISPKVNLDKISPMDQSLVKHGEQAEVMEKLNEDVKDLETLFSSLDKKSRLHEYEVSQFAVHDLACTTLECLPQECMNTTRKMLGLKISKDGEGRKELVTIAGGIKKQKVKEGFFKKMFSFPSGKKEESQNEE